MPAKRRQKALPPVTCGAVVIRRYRLGDGRVVIAYRDRDQKRKRQTFTDPAAAKVEAERKARELHNAGGDAPIFTAAERAEFIHARQEVMPWGRSVFDAAHEWSEAKKSINGSGHKFSEVIAAGLAALQRTPHPVADVVAELLRSKTAKALNGRYERGLETTLTKFAEAFPGEIREITPASIEKFLDAREVGPRRRDNILNELRHLFEFARLRSYLPNEITVASKVPKVNSRGAAISFFTVGEMRLMLEHVREEWLPFLAIACFAGIRTEEITRAKDAAKHKQPLRWSDFDWQEREIHIGKHTAKTGVARIVPISDNLFAWLQPWRDAGEQGLVAPASRPDREFGKNGRLERAINRALQDAPRLRTERPVQLELAAITPAQPDLLTEFAWRHNALRHSYGSYRASIIKNMPQLAEEMGNSIAMIQQHYRNPRPASQAKAWFAILPPQDKKIVDFSAAAA